jgi:hypothetical protein
MRFTLGKMFLAVAVLALACAGMMYRTRLWASGIFSLTLIFFVVALLQVIRLHGRERIVAVVLSATGLAYLIFATAAPFHGARELLVTNYPLAWAAKWLGVATIVNPGGPNTISYVTSTGTTGVPTTSMIVVPQTEWDTETTIAMGTSAEDGNDPLRHFFIIGHCLFACLFAVLGGWFGGRMVDRRKAPPAA